MPEKPSVPHSGTLRDHYLRFLEIKTAPDSRTIFLDPARLMRWVYVARLSIASAIFIAAVIASLKGPLQDTGQLLVVSVTFLVTFAVTAASAFYSRLRKLQLRPNFYYLQSVFDLLLVTAVVHLITDRLIFPKGKDLVVTLDSPTKSLRIATVNHQGGSLTLQVVVTTPDSAVVLARAAIQVRIAGTSVVGYLLTIASLLVLALWWWRTYRRRSKGQHAR